MVYYILYVILFSYFFNTIVTFDKILSKILSYCYVKRNDMYTHIEYTSWISGGFMSGFMSGIIDRVKGDMHYLFKKGTDGRRHCGGDGPYAECGFCGKRTRL